MKLSIIIPVYYNEKNLQILYENLNEEVLKKLDMDYEIIMVDDGSNDNSFNEMEKLKDINEKIIIVKLSRNFGSHAAILAGLSVASGDCATVKAADLQEPSEIILEMLNKWKSGIKTVLAVRSDREESFFQKKCSNTYYNVMRKFALQNMPKGGFDCFLIDRAVIDQLNSMEEKNTSLMGQILWCGFETDTIYYIRKKREIGKSKWTLSKKIKLFIDSLLGFSYAPIRVFFTIGIIYFICAILYSLYIIIYKIAYGFPVEGYATTIIIVLFSFGLMMLNLGILGEYLWRAFDASRKRPVYIIEKVEK